jgi:membrane protein YqaA with SNARE-associated domain
MGILPLAAVKTSPPLPWIIRLGGPGLILLGLADNSVIPLPGSMDALTIWLAGKNREIWFYYAFMATFGAVIGGYLTYNLARKGGKGALQRRLPAKKMDSMNEKFAHFGFGAVAVPALLPPPFPIVPALLAAGAMQYPRKKFLTALAVGRGIRYTVVAFLGAHFGPHIVAFFSKYYKPALFTLIGMAAVSGVFAIIEYLRLRRRREKLPAKPDKPAGGRRAA